MTLMKPDFGILNYWNQIRWIAWWSIKLSVHKNTFRTFSNITVNEELCYITRRTFRPSASTYKSDLNWILQETHSNAEPRIYPVRYGHGYYTNDMERRQYFSTYVSLIRWECNWICSNVLLKWTYKRFKHI